MIYNKEERIGVYSVAKIFSENLGWIFREQPISDFGIDGFVEITKCDFILKDSIPTGRLIGVQIKSGKSFFKESTDEYFVYRGSKKHLIYWLNHSIPVIIVFYDKETNSAYWEEVNIATIFLTKKSFKINISKRNLLNHKAKPSLTNIGFYKNSYDYKLWQLRASINEIEILIKTKLFLYVEIESASNPYDYYISLLLTDEDCDDKAEIFYRLYDGNPNRYFYHYFLLKDKSLKESINDTLPWIDLFIGEVDFSDELLTKQISDEILSFNQEDFKNDVLQMKKENSFLSLACYLTGFYNFRLEVKPNELADSFQIINDFLNKEPVVKQRIFL
jgi:hypothetical protein